MVYVINSDTEYIIPCNVFIISVMEMQAIITTDPCQ